MRFKRLFSARPLRQALAIAIISICAFSLGFIFGRLPSETNTITIEPKSLTETVNYVIWTDGIMVYAKNGRTNQIDFSGADAATIIQSAINALPEAEGCILIKSGYYIINATINLRSHMTLMGEGRDTRLIHRVRDAPCIMIAGTKEKPKYDILLSDFTIEGTPVSGDGIYLEYCVNIWISRLYIVLCGAGNGLHAKNSSFSSITLCSIEENGLNGIRLTSCEEWRITNNGIKGNSWHGIWLDGSHINTITANHISRNMKNGIYMTWASGNIIAENHIFWNDANNTGSWDGIDLLSSDSNMIIGNYLLTNRGRAIDISDKECNHNHITNNFITGEHIPPQIRNLGKENTIKGNVGFTTENGGTAIIPAGSKSITIPHGLPETPKIVVATPRANIGTIWVSNRNETHITISCSTAPVEDIIIDWYAELGR